MKNNNKNNNKFFGLSASEKAKVVRKAVDSAAKEQRDMVKKHGGMRVIRKYSKCTSI